MTLPSKSSYTRNPSWRYNICPQCGDLKSYRATLCRKCLSANVLARNNGLDKLCVRCNERFPLDGFNVNRASQDGLSAWCKTCACEVSKKRNQESRNIESASGRRICKQCAASKERSEFSDHVNGLGIRWICKDCIQKNHEAITHQWCPRCQRDLPLDEFHNSKQRRLGKTWVCKTCTTKMSRERKGLPKGWYEERLILQDGKCGICSTNLIKEDAQDRNYCHVDHDHGCCPATKYCGECARGLLCGRCNRSIGFIENEDWIKKVLSYLHQFGAMTKLRWVEDDEPI